MNKRNDRISGIFSLYFIFLIVVVVTSGCLKAEVTDVPKEKVGGKTLEKELPEEVVEEKMIHSLVYVFNIGDESVSIINTSTGRVIDIKSAGFRSKWPANQYWDGEVMWTVDDGTSNVTVVNLTNFEVLGSIDAGNLPLTVELTPDRKFAYVSVQMDDVVAVIDTSSYEIVKKIRIPKGSNMSISHPCDTIITHDGKWVYVPNEWANTLSIVSTETNEVVKTIQTGKRPWKGAISPDDMYVFLVNMDEDTVSIIDTAVMEEIKRIQVGDKPYATELTLDGKFAYVANLGNGTVSVIDVSLLEVVKTVQVGKKPAYIAIGPEGGFAYVSNSGDNTMSVMDTSEHEVIDTMPVGKKPRGMLVETH